MFTLSKRYLLLEAATYRGKGGVSAENQTLGFVPAFKDTATGIVYPATFADGRPAPYHVLDGLPDELVIARDRRGVAAQVVGTIIAGFLRKGVFFTREEAAAAVQDALQATVPQPG
jgi:hypothetical protein